MRIPAILSLLLFLPAPALAEDRYSVKFDQDLDGVEVNACFGGNTPERLYRHEDSARYTSWIRSGGEALQVSASRTSIRLPRLKPGACVDYRVELRAAARNMNRRTGFEIGGDLVVETSLWFWKGNRERDITVHVSLPEGLSFSTPWPDADGSAPGTSFRPDRTLSSWTSRTAVGRFRVEYIQVPGSSVRLAAIGGLDDRQKQRIRDWIEQSVLAVTSVYGSFPQPVPQVIVVPIGKRNEAVPWARVIRGGGLAVELYIDETRPLREFTSDWTAIHEFSHLLLPHVSSRDRWLSEGLASYYQNVLRARNGVLSDQQAWQKLHEGFRRGQRGTRSGTLATAARSGWRSTMRVYWSGAALMLMADTQLRSMTAGRQSLDTALAQLRECCLANGRTWRARDLMDRLDQLTGTGVFSRLYREHVYDDDFPDLTDTWEELGLKTRFDRVTLLPEAPLAGIRDAIMGG